LGVQTYAFALCAFDVGRADGGYFVRKGDLGRTHTDTVAQAAEVTFSNEVSAIGTTNIKGETVKIFRETNQGNKGPTDGFFRRDKTGITYYGSQPTTPFEQQLIPYRVLAYPLV